MIKKTVVALSVATLATAAIALPTAVSQAAETPIQIAAGCNPCNPCAAEPVQSLQSLQSLRGQEKPLQSLCGREPVQSVQPLRGEEPLQPLRSELAHLRVNFVCRGAGAPAAFRTLPLPWSAAARLLFSSPPRRAPIRVAALRPRVC